MDKAQLLHCFTISLATRQADAVREQLLDSKLLRLPKPSSSASKAGSVGGSRAERSKRHFRLGDDINPPKRFGEGSYAAPFAKAHRFGPGAAVSADEVRRCRFPPALACGVCASAWL